MRANQQALSGLTGARFFAAILVMFEHSAPFVHWPSSIWPLTTIAGPAVSFFFVLSGFVLTYNYADWFRQEVSTTRAKDFFVARFARIYPMYLATLLLSVPVTLLALSAHARSGPTPHWPGDPSAVAAWLVSACLLQVYIPNHSLGSIWNGPCWSVGCEAFFYLSFPMVTWTLVRFLATGRRDSSTRAVFLIFAALAWEYCTIWLTPFLVTHFVHGARGEAVASSIVYYWPPARLAEFLIGCTAGHLFLNGSISAVLRIRAVREITSVAIIAGIVLVAWRFPASKVGRFGYFSVHTPLAVGLVVVLASGRSAVTTILDSPVLILLGEASYSLYLLHWSAILLFCACVGPVWGWLVSAAFFSLLPLFSIATFFWVERPARKWIRRRSPVGFTVAGAT